LPPGSPRDQLVVAGPAKLAGTLNKSWLKGFAGSAFHLFVIHWPVVSWLWD
jgi:hypothetical protein